MSVSGFAFVDSEMVVVNAIGGDLSPEQISLFERDYRVLFGAEFSVPVTEGITVWIGGMYNPEDGTFAPPVQELPVAAEQNVDEVAG
jgi:hypothetical protein